MSSHVTMEEFESQARVTMNDEEKALCGCDRPVAYVVCESCGYTFKGRVQQHCPLHAGILLMDHNTCPKCFSKRLQEFQDQAADPLVQSIHSSPKGSPVKSQFQHSPSRSQKSSPSAEQPNSPQRPQTRPQAHPNRKFLPALQPMAQHGFFERWN